MARPRVPIIEIYGYLIVSVQGELDDAQVDLLRDDVSAAIERRDPRGLVVDLSGVDVLDSYLTRALRDLAVTARLMGVRTAVCGLRPAIAITLVDMDLTIPGAVLAMNLERAIEKLAEEEAGTEPATADAG
jgi:rsbT antagonist protein RsbS